MDINYKMTANKNLRMKNYSENRNVDIKRKGKEERKVVRKIKKWLIRKSHYMERRIEQNRKKYEKKNGG